MLRDLDELVLECRSPRSRAYVAEAVAAYRVGAYRSAIVATWIAIVFDFIDKLRELELTGNNLASQVLADVEKARLNSNFEASLRFERDLLEIAGTKFELLSPLQRTDLARLQDDRNRCAHPSFQTAEEPYAPSAELARYHLDSAISHMLSQGPVQGKAALNRILAEIRLDQFPVDQFRAQKHLAQGPLSRPSAPLVRNLILCLVKGLLKEISDVDGDLAHRYRVALLAVGHLHPGSTDDTLRQELPRLASGLEQDDLLRLLSFVRYIPVAIHLIGEPNVMRLEEFVLKPPNDLRSQIVQLAIPVTLLTESALSAITKLADDDLERLLEIDLSPAILDEAVRRFADSTSYDQAKRRSGRLLLAHIDRLTEAQADTIRESFVQNKQVLGSFGTASLLRAMIRHESPGPDEIPAHWLAFHQRFAADDSPEMTSELRMLLESYFPDLTGEAEEDQ